nr:uncharacterized protein CTRU02_04212 [Colletotrichum truncatum]KAF6796251.1 hypothetical protein CTRU02_04212 [Colletotrichum truncatum]
MLNPFIVGVAPDSPYRLAVLDEHRALPDLKVPISLDREYNTLRISGEAALLDAVDRLRELEDRLAQQTLKISTSQKLNAPSLIKPKVSVPAKRKSCAPAEPRRLRTFLTSLTTDTIQSDQEI